MNRAYGTRVIDICFFRWTEVQRYKITRAYLPTGQAGGSWRWR
jgi:hypothetical protein